MALRLLDANVFIQAKNSYYSFDLVPAFWSWLHLQANAGALASIDLVYTELKDGSDELARWVKGRRQAIFHVGSSSPVVAGHIASPYTWAQGAPPPVVPMDGFHLAQAVIDQRGLGDRKGSPETFDPWGFVNLVARLARPADDATVYAPEFDRDIEEPIAGAIPIRSTEGLVIVEGNYLLLSESPWVQLRGLLDLCVYLEVDDAIRIGWLIDRHVSYGKSRIEAERFVHNSDEANAHLIKPTRSRAELIVTPG